jgi:hypothetical protein
MSVAIRARPSPAIRSDGIPHDPRPTLIIRSTVAGAAVLYALLLWFDYRNFISPSFSYMSFFFYDHSLMLLIADLALVALPIFYLPISVQRPSDLALTFIYIIVYIPSILLTTAAAVVVTPQHIVLKLMMVASLWVIAATAKFGGGTKLPTEGMKPVTFMPLMLVLAALCVAVIGMTFGLELKFHALREVYDQRDDYKEALNNAAYMNYVIGILAHVIVPILLSYALVFRAPAYGVIGIVLTLYVFSVTGLKSSVLAVVYVIAVFMALRYFRSRFMLVSLLASSAILIFGMMTSGALHLDVVNDLFARRTFIIQGLLTNIYFEFMQMRPPLYLSHSILRPFFNVPVMSDPDGVVGEAFFNGVVHANASLWADGYMNARYIGIFIAAGVTGLFLAMINFCCSRSDVKMACCSMAMVFMMICQTGIIKVVGVQGGLVCCLLYLFADFRAKSRQPINYSRLRAVSAAAPGATE